MAPEISTGNYGKQIDVYAAGVILYEMLTGRVPFDGESCGEILMKHLTSPPDLSKVPREWVAIVSKALSKNPAHRYASMSEMARDVEAVGQEPELVPGRVVAGAGEPDPGGGRRPGPAPARRRGRCWGRVGRLLQLLRPGVRPAALVADDRPPALSPVQLRSRAGGRVLGGRPPAADSPA